MDFDGPAARSKGCKMPPTNLVIVSPTLSAEFEPTGSRAAQTSAASNPPADVVSYSVRDGETEPARDAAGIVRRLREEIGPHNYQLWFGERTSLTIHGEELIVGTGSPFLQSWLQRQFREQVGRVAASLLGPAARVRFVVDVSLSQPDQTVPTVSRQSHALSSVHATDRAARKSMDASHETQPANLIVSPPTAVSHVAQREATRPTANGAGPARRFANLSNFVPGDCNQLALTAVNQVAAAPGERLNPLYLHGGVGLGKTHLLEGLYCELRRLQPMLNVLFLTSEQFANYFTQALRTHTLPSFRQRFRGVDVLLVDDIDFLDGKRGIQEEFLHTVRSLEAHGKQIVVTSDRHPRLLSASSDELTTRFTSGLVCRLDAPDLATRTKIVQHKLIGRSVSVLPEAVALVAQWFRHNVRELEGALNCLEAHAALQRRPISAALAREILADLQRDCVRIVKLADVERAICELFRLVPEELRSSSRTRQISQPRMLAMFLARKLTQAAYSEIGEYFGGRNHSTVISAEKQVQTWIEADTKLTLAAREWSVGELLLTLERHALAS